MKGILLATASAVALLAAAPAFADQADDLKAQIEALKKQVAQQQKLLDSLAAQVKSTKHQDAKPATVATQAVTTQPAATYAAPADAPAPAAADVGHATMADAPPPAPPKDAAKFSMKNGRPTFETADGRFSAQLRTLAQFDWGYYSQNASAHALPAAYGPDLSSGTNFRRVYLGVQGRLFGDWSYNFNYDFGGSGGTESPGRIQSVYLQYDGWKPWAIRAGGYAPPANIEDGTAPADTLFLERNAPSDLQRNIAGGDGRDAISIIYGGDRLFGALTYSGGKVQDAAVFDEQQAVLGRASYMLVSEADTHLMFGANGTYVFALPDAVANGAATLATTPGATALNSFTFSDPPEITIDSNGIRLTNTGSLPADRVSQWGVETAGNFMNFYAQAGYYDFELSRAPVAYNVFSGPGVSAAHIVQPHDNSFSGWYVQASWILTGETKAYNPATGAFTSPKPAHPVDMGGGYGAWEIAARYSDLNLNDDVDNPDNVITAWTGATNRTYTYYNTVRGGEQTAYTVALNWYANEDIRFGLDYQWIDLDRLQSGATPNSVTGVTTTTTGVPTIPKLSADQTVQTVAVRAQFGF